MHTSVVVNSENVTIKHTLLKTVLQAIFLWQTLLFLTSTTIMQLAPKATEFPHFQDMVKLVNIFLSTRDASV